MKILAGRLRGRSIDTPSDGGTRPALGKLRGALFDMLDPDLPGAHVLDLYAGSGSLGIEALSRGAASVLFVELRRPAQRVLERNLRKLDLVDVCQVVGADALELPDVLRREGGFDVILSDPPFEMVREGRTEALHARLAADWLARDGLLVMRLPADVAPPAPAPDTVRLRDRRYGDSRLLIDHLAEPS